MLLSAKRSTLLTPGSSAEPIGKSALLSAAATRLHVPQNIAEDFSASAAIEQGRDQVVVAGRADADIADALRGKLHLFLVLDCLVPAERPAMEDLASQGITPVTAEMVVFEWLERADSDDFRAMLKLIR